MTTQLTRAINRWQLRMDALLLELNLIRRAYLVARHWHRSQRRFKGLDK